MINLNLTINIKRLLIIFILALISVNLSFAQQNSFAPKDFYLIDSLVLNELTTANRILVDSCLKQYHACNNDTFRIIALNGIISILNHNASGKYLLFQHDLINTAIQNAPSASASQYLKNSFLFSALFKKCL